MSGGPGLRAYEILSSMGARGMGDVYKARDTAQCFACGEGYCVRISLAQRRGEDAGDCPEDAFFSVALGELGKRPKHFTRGWYDHCSSTIRLVTWVGYRIEQ